MNSLALGIAIGAALATGVASLVVYGRRSVRMHDSLPPGPPAPARPYVDDVFRPSNEWGFDAFDRAMPKDARGTCDPPWHHPLCDCR